MVVSEPKVCFLQDSWSWITSDSPSRASPAAPGTPLPRYLGGRCQALHRHVGELENSPCCLSLELKASAARGASAWACPPIMAQQSSARTWTPGTPHIGVWLGGLRWTSGKMEDWPRSPRPSLWRCLGDGSGRASGPIWNACPQQAGGLITAASVASP